MKDMYGIHKGRSKANMTEPGSDKLLPGPTEEPTLPSVYTEFLNSHNPTQSVKEGELFFIFGAKTGNVYAFVIKNGNILSCVGQRSDATVDTNGDEIIEPRPKEKTRGRGKRWEESDESSVMDSDDDNASGGDSDSDSNRSRKSKSKSRNITQKKKIFSYDFGNESGEDDVDGEPDTNDQLKNRQKLNIRTVYILDVVNFPIITPVEYTINSNSIISYGIPLLKGYTHSLRYLFYYFLQWLFYRGWEEALQLVEKYKKLDDIESKLEKRIELVEPYDLYFADVFESEKKANPGLTIPKLVKKIRNTWDTDISLLKVSKYRDEADRLNEKKRRKIAQLEKQREEAGKIRRVFRYVDSARLTSLWKGSYQIEQSGRYRQKEMSLKMPASMIENLIENQMRNLRHKVYTPYRVFSYDNGILYPYDMSDPNKGYEPPENPPIGELLMLFVDAFTALHDDYQQVYYSVGSNIGEVEKARQRFVETQKNLRSTTDQTKAAARRSKSPKTTTRSRSVSPVPAKNRNGRFVRSRSVSPEPTKNGKGKHTRPASRTVSVSPKPTRASARSKSRSRSESSSEETKKPSKSKKSPRKSPSKARSSAKRKPK